MIMSQIAFAPVPGASGPSGLATMPARYHLQHQDNPRHEPPVQAVQ
jgi:hypothetical protein